MIMQACSRDQSNLSMVDSSVFSGIELNSPQKQQIIISSQQDINNRNNHNNNQGQIITPALTFDNLQQYQHQLYSLKLQSIQKTNKLTYLTIQLNRQRQETTYWKKLLQSEKYSIKQFYETVIIGEIKERHCQQMQQMEKKYKLVIERNSQQLAEMKRTVEELVIKKQQLEVDNKERQQKQHRLINVIKEMKFLLEENDKKYTHKLNQANNQLRTYQQRVKALVRQIQEKNYFLNQKQQQIDKLQIKVRKLQHKLDIIEKQHQRSLSKSQRKLQRQVSITKNLQKIHNMQKKYLEHEVKEGKMKEKYFTKEKKQLISRIKQMRSVNNDNITSRNITLLSLSQLQAQQQQSMSQVNNNQNVINENTQGQNTDIYSKTTPISRQSSISSRSFTKYLLDVDESKNNMSSIEVSPKEKNKAVEVRKKNNSHKVKLMKNKQYTNNSNSMTQKTNKIIEGSNNSPISNLNKLSATKITKFYPNRTVGNSPNNDHHQQTLKQKQPNYQEISLNTQKHDTNKTDRQCDEQAVIRSFKKGSAERGNIDQKQGSVSVSPVTEFDMVRQIEQLRLLQMHMRASFNPSHTINQINSWNDSRDSIEYKTLCRVNQDKSYYKNTNKTLDCSINNQQKTNTLGRTKNTIKQNYSELKCQEEVPVISHFEIVNQRQQLVENGNKSINQISMKSTKAFEQIEDILNMTIRDSTLNNDSNKIKTKNNNTQDERQRLFQSVEIRKNSYHPSIQQISTNNDSTDNHQIQSKITMNLSDLDHRVRLSNLDTPSFESSRQYSQNFHNKVMAYQQVRKNHKMNVVKNKDRKISINISILNSNNNNNNTHANININKKQQNKYKK